MLTEMLKKYPDFPSFIMIKIEAQRRGIRFTKSALSKVNPAVHQTKVRSFSRENNNAVPVALTLRDGTSVIARERNIVGYEEPLIIDVDKDGHIVIKDNDLTLEQVFFWEKPDYYDKLTKSGIPMWQIVNARPQRLDINPYQFCQMWRSPSLGCKFCGINGTYNNTKKSAYLNINDIDETITEALKEQGRYTNIFITGGINMGGEDLFDNEVKYYIKLLKKIGKHFSTQKFPSQLLGAAYNRRQLLNIYEETGLMSYSANLEVLDKDKFTWICPGKAAYVGYDEWKDRLIQAVDIFGRGYVNTGLVSGVELAKPYGFLYEDEGVERTLEEAETLIKHGVDVVSCVWRIAEEAIFHDQNPPSLEYYIRIARGLDYLRKKYKLYSDMDNYRRCGNHPDTDILRVW